MYPTLHLGQAILEQRIRHHHLRPQARLHTTRI